MTKTLEPWYFDNTILSTFRSCKEKANLSHEEHWHPKEPSKPLTFGGAIHAALDTFYTSDLDDRKARVELAQADFIRYARANGVLPINIDNAEGEKRSLERGIAILEAYFDKWQGESFTVYRDAGTGKPLVEAGFELHLFNWPTREGERPIFYVGRIDKIVRSRADGQLYNFETKTTSTGLGNFVQEVIPNHQVSSYHLAAQSLLGLKVVATIWDCIFISTRQPDMKSKDQWRRLGIDQEKDFARTETRRSELDLDEFLKDLHDDALEYLTWRDKNRDRWPRNTAVCHMYGGCAFKRVCASNKNPMILSNYYEKKVWDPRVPASEKLLTGG